MTNKRVSEKEIVLSTPAPARHKPASAKRVKRAMPAAAEEVAAPTARVTPSPEQIAVLAYLYWEARGCQGGSPEEDWLRAEQELAAAASA